MNILDEIKKNDTVRNYWTKVLGSECLENILEHPWLIQRYKTQEEGNRAIESFLAFHCSGEFLKEEKLYVPEETLFRPFALRVAGWLHMSLKPAVGCGCGEAVLPGLVKVMGEKLMGLCMRCLINEMKEWKANGGGKTPKDTSVKGTFAAVENGLFKEADSRAEYAYFCSHYLGEHELQNQIFLKYPVMTALIMEKTKHWTAAVEEMLKRLKADRAALGTMTCMESGPLKITDIAWGLSDEHVDGQVVMRLTFNEKSRVYYKPHSLEQAAAYDRIHAWLLRRLGLEAAETARIVRENYGWEMEVKHLPCASLGEVEEFYERAGTQLCLAYIFGISDIHKGNLIARGKYPVIIDLETFPGIYGENRDNAPVKPWVYTVQRSGLLPVIGPGNVVLSAIGSGEAQTASYKMPAVLHRATSDMDMGFKEIVVKCDENLPVFEGRNCDVRNYISRLVKGFEKAFSYILDHRNVFYEMTERLLPSVSRQVLQNTQAYFMYQNISLRPELLQYGELRALMLRQMEKALSCPEAFKAQILDYELDCIDHLRFPVYYACGRDLHMGNGTTLNAYFTRSGEELVRERLRLLSKDELRRQSRVIELAFLQMFKKNEDSYRHYCRETGCKALGVYTAEMIGGMLLAAMEKQENAQPWLGIHYYENGNFALKPVDDYFYGGIAGIAVFLKAAGIFYNRKEYEAAFEMVLHRLDGHTQEVCRENKHSSRAALGLFSGETSFVYAYRLLYQITGNMDYFDRACSHCDYVLARLGDIRGADLLGGKAGVLLMLAEMYKDTGHKKYLEGARELFGRLMGEARIFDQGIGWINETQEQPLAGMAHGSSGIAMALAALWRVDKKDDYLCAIEEALSYEDSLYCFQWKNWKDMRGCPSGETEGKDTLAWCHGAAGISAARFVIYTLTGRWYGKSLVEHALPEIRNTVKADQCLCHGNLGLLRILKVISRQEGCIGKSFDGVSGVFENAGSGLTAWRYRDGFLSVEDRQNPGFMNGLAGIGYALLQEAGMDLPEVLLGGLI